MPKKEEKKEEKSVAEESTVAAEKEKGTASQEVQETQTPATDTNTVEPTTPQIPEPETTISMTPVGETPVQSSTPEQVPAQQTVQPTITTPSETLPIDQAGEKPIQETYPLADEIEKEALKKKSFFSSLLIFRNKKGKIILLILVILILLGLGAGTILNAKNEKLSFITKRSKTRETVQLSPTQAPIPTPTSEPVDKKTISIQVQNGNGESGVAGKMKNLLIENGYEGTIDTGNADNYDYTNTVLKVKKTKLGIEKDLRESISKDYTLSETTEELSEDSEYDIIIIVGAE